MKRFFSLVIALTVSGGAVAQSSPAFQTAPVSTSPITTTNAPVMSANAELLFMVEQLQREVQSLRGVVEEQSHQIKQLKQQGRDRYRDLDQRILQLKTNKGQGASGLSAPPVISGAGAGASVNAAVQTVQQAGSKNKPNSSVTAATPSTSIASGNTKSAPSAEQERAYQQAYDLIKQKKYDQAVDQLHSFISRYPNSDLTGNAYYWLGEVYLVMPKYEQARQAFTVVVGSFATHRKAADAMFKLGVTYDKLGNKEQAKFYLDEVVKRYPQSSAAKLSKEYKAK